MGTLDDQPPRQDSLARYAEWVCRIGKELGYDMTNSDDVRAACDVIRVALAIQNADVLDEQLSGFASLLTDYIEREPE